MCETLDLDMFSDEHVMNISPFSLFVIVIDLSAIVTLKFFFNVSKSSADESIGIHPWFDAVSDAVFDGGSTDRFHNFLHHKDPCSCS